MHAKKRTFIYQVLQGFWYILLKNYKPLKSVDHKFHAFDLIEFTKH